MGAGNDDLGILPFVQPSTVEKGDDHCGYKKFGRTGDALREATACRLLLKVLEAFCRPLYYRIMGAIYSYQLVRFVLYWVSVAESLTQIMEPVDN
jgi:hypothetical protein